MPSQPENLEQQYAQALADGISKRDVMASYFARLDLARRAPRCIHIKTNGLRCGSPARRRSSYCHFHQRIFHARRGLDLPILEDHESVQCALMQVSNALIHQTLDHRTAGLLLYALQTAAINLRHANFDPGPDAFQRDLDDERDYGHFRRQALQAEDSPSSSSVPSPPAPSAPPAPGAPDDVIRNSSFAIRNSPHSQFEIPHSDSASDSADDWPLDFIRDAARAIDRSGVALDPEKLR